jgi:hypothetical protein
MQLASIGPPRDRDVRSTLPSSAGDPEATHSHLLLAFLTDEGLSGAQADRIRRLAVGSNPWIAPQYKHPAKSGLLTVPGKPSDELHPKTVSSILKQAGLRGNTGSTSAAGERKET